MKLAKLVIGLFLLGAALPAFSKTVTYILGDHEDGALYDDVSTSGPSGPYGLRYDAIDPPNGNGPTFSVGDNLGGLGGLVTLTWDDANLAAGATISGSMSRNDTVANGNGDIWTVTYTLTGLVDDGNGGWTATGGSGSMNDGGAPVILTGLQDGSGYAFIFANDGHRLDGDPGVGWVGRGWLTGGGTDDWLVTAVIPVPAAIWLFPSALAALGWMRRRRSV